MINNPLLNVPKCLKGKIVYYILYFCDKPSNAVFFCVTVRIRKKKRDAHIVVVSNIRWEP